MESLLTTAIKTLQVIEFYYEGKLRVVEPFCYGTSTAGHEALRAFQIDGYSSSGKPLGWRLYEVSKITGLTLSGRCFVPDRAGYNRSDKAMRWIRCAV